MIPIIIAIASRFSDEFNNPNLMGAQRNAITTNTSTYLIVCSKKIFFSKVFIVNISL
jgi:hypothetical protein